MPCASKWCMPFFFKINFMLPIKQYQLLNKLCSMIGVYSPLQRTLIMLSVVKWLCASETYDFYSFASMNVCSPPSLHMGVIWPSGWNNFLPLSLYPFVIVSYYMDKGVPCVPILLSVIILQAIMKGAVLITWQSNESVWFAYFKVCLYFVKYSPRSS